MNSGIIVADDNAYNYTLSQCGISFGDHYSLKWQVIGKRVHFELILSSIPKDEDFWTGIGFSKIQINSPVNESEVLAILKLQEAISLENFSIKSGKIESADSMNDNDEQTAFTYAFKNPTSLDSNFTRSLYADHSFNNSISDCAIWTFYTRPVLMNETFVDPVFDALICNLSALCIPYSINNSSNELHTRNRRQTFATNNIQTSRTNNIEIPKLYNPVINPSSPNYTAVLRQNQEALSKYEDFSCTLPDPYWCESYVKQYIHWQQTYNNLSILRICVPLKTSVANADNRCCQAVRSIGC
uniref:DOMON domain-containing protein n=1 Tax=Onchocerca volvulus TaxID=6282 RepID=A0A8R1XY20_ONCVO